MAAMLFSVLLLASVSQPASSTEIDVNGIAVDAFQASGSAELFLQAEAQVINTLIELDAQLDNALHELSSASGAAEIDVVVGQSDGGSGLLIDDEIVVVIPGSRLSEAEEDEIKDEIETQVAQVLDGMIVEQAEVEQGPEVTDAAAVERLFEEEAEAEQELQQMEDELKSALDTLPSDGGSLEIDIVVSESDDENQQEVVDDEIVVIIPASTGSGPRLTEEEKHELEEEVVEEAADALGAIVMRDFVANIAAMQTSAPETEITLQLPDDPRLEEQENALQQREAAATDVAQAAWAEEAPEPEPKPVFRSAVATAITQPGFEHPMFVPNQWQTSDEQLWTMKLSMLTSISCVTLLLIVGVWTGVRRSRRYAVLDDNHFRWAETVEYMDAFPNDP
ncbi:hypothetical protein PF005_g10435 [Phytophthora fragariae]|uniref:Uncharacterized protein n=1 Tax=Phytophthora fragariae TaxID=53985 RepID=A0A6A4DPP1_9STRA|nr:hypothetical protein PF003_g30156 [Phytophthora fragariae]KAE8937490.1 hypothetical protein PF009_g12608 [Phytophthora fragariae]KAE9010716.1 hypothetical protein PF011_g9700 [Phytophthora fragariae]KAE9112545.1 hypothetical protein PF010_g10409 [Phytophthora fragariae]KAE9112876.1 hypothetical protein PF007_g10941 [Phytophthora fragariae]